MRTSQADAEQARRELSQLLEKYTPDHRNVKAFKEQIPKLDARLATLENERKVLTSQLLAQPVPNTNIGLLKIMAIQNEMILDLLVEILARNTGPRAQ